MPGAIDRYLDKVMTVAALEDSTREAQIRGELRDHIEQKAETLRSAGSEPAEALIQAIELHGNAVVIGYRLRPWRFLDVRLRGTARGVIAIGPKAQGIVAIGGVAMGVIAFGGVAIGAFGFGGFALALLAWGGLACGGVAYGGLAAGLVAFGGGAFGVVAVGGMAAGLWVPGAGQTLWSHYNWQTAPALLHGIGSHLVIGPPGSPERDWAMRLEMILTLITFVVLGIGMWLQLGLMNKERKRLAGVDINMGC